MSLPARLLVHTVSVHRQVDGVGSDLEPKRTYPVRAGMEAVRCRVVELSRRDLTLYQQAGLEVVGVVYFPGTPAISPTDQLRWAEGGRVYQVLAVRDVHGLGHHLEVEVKARVV